MAKITYADKTNRIPVADPDQQVSAENMNEIKDSVNEVYDGANDNITNTYIPIKLSGAFANAPIHWSGVSGQDIVFDEAIDLPPGTMKIGEGQSTSAIGVIPFWTSSLTGYTYSGILHRYNTTTGSVDRPFTSSFAGATDIVVSGGTDSVPLTGTIPITTTAIEAILAFKFLTDPSATVNGIRVVVTSVATGNPLYYYPTKAKYLAGEGNDLTADGSGNISVDISHAPLGLLSGQALTYTYAADSGVIKGTGVIPALTISRMITTLKSVIIDDGSGNVSVDGDVHVGRNVVVNGTITSQSTENLLVTDNHILLNNGYVSTAAISGGVVHNLQSTGLTDTVTAGAFVAGVASTSNPTVATVGATTFAENDIVMINTSADNNGLYEVHSQAANLLTIRGVGTIPTVEGFTNNQFIASASDSATITKVNVAVLCSDTDGDWRQGKGSVTPITFADIGDDLWSRTGTVLSPLTSGDNITTTGNIAVGTTTQLGKLNVFGDTYIGDETADVYLTGVPASGGDFNIKQTSGAGKIKFVSNGNADLVTIQNDGDMGIGKVPTEKLDVNGIAKAITFSGDLNGTINTATTGTTQSAADNSTKIATTAYVDTAVGEEDIWDRSGTTISPKTAGDDVTTTGDIAAGNIAVGNNLGISQSATTLVVGNTAGYDAKMYFGQATNTNLVLAWDYDATPADSVARMTTWGYANDLYIDGKTLILQGSSGGNIAVGKATADTKLDVSGDAKADTFVGAYANTKTLNTCESLDDFGSTLGSFALSSNSKLGSYSVAGTYPATSTASRAIYSTKDYGDLTDFANDNDFFEFWFYVSSVSDLDVTNIYIELGNTQDTAEYEWNQTHLPTLVDGWNKVALRMGDATQGPVNWASGVDHFRIFFRGTGTNAAFNVSIDDMRMTSNRKESVPRDLTLNGDIVSFGNATLDSNETEGDILAINGNDLTAGTAISINSTSNSDITRNFVEIRHSGTGGNTHGIDMNLGDSNGTMFAGSSSNTTQPGLRLDCNDLTYGAVAHFASMSTDTNIRKLVHIQNASALATGTTGLVIDQASTGKAISTNGNITAGSYDGVLNDGVTATTQSAGDNSTKVATTAYSDAIPNIYSANGELASTRHVVGENSKSLTVEMFDPTESNYTTKTAIIQQDDQIDLLQVTGNGSGDEGAYLGIRLGQGSTNKLEFIDEKYTKGAVYNADYSANFTDRSIVDKAFVDNAISGLNPSGTHDILIAADLEALATSKIITVTTGTTLTLNIKGAISSDTRYVIESGGRLNLNYALSGSYTYTETGTQDQFTSTQGSLFIRNGSMTATGTLSTLFNNTFNSPFQVVNIKGTIFTGYHGGALTGWGSFTFDGSPIVDYRDSLTVSGHAGLKCINVSGYSYTVFPNKPVFDIKRGYGGTAVNVFSLGSWSLYGGSFLRIDPGVGDSSKNLIDGIVINLGDLLDTSGTSGTFTAVADASFSTVTINNVTSSGGNARFNCTIVPSFSVGQEVTIVGFLTYTAYNKSSIVTATDGSTYFEIDSTPYIGSENGTGNFGSSTVTLTDTGTTLANGDTITLDTPVTHMYQGGTNVYNKQTNSVQVNATWNATATGTWSKAGLNCADPRVLCNNNPGFTDSTYIGSFHVNGNTTATTVSVINTWYDLDLNSSAVASSNMERWKLTDNDAGEIKYIGNEPFSGNLAASITGGGEVGAQTYLFRAVVNGSPTSDGISAGTTTPAGLRNVALITPIVVSNGDLVRIQVQNTVGTNNFTVNEIAVNIQ
ncbi:MAG: hypothetical protein GY714_18335 [Desulfobacterales bacterium]|nr:hypothetical protein [Desulfobacterales bacterium]